MYYVMDTVQVINGTYFNSSKLDTYFALMYALLKLSP